METLAPVGAKASDQLQPLVAVRHVESLSPSLKGHTAASEEYMI